MQVRISRHERWRRSCLIIFNETALKNCFLLCLYSWALEMNGRIKGSLTGRDRRRDKSRREGSGQPSSFSNLQLFLATSSSPETCTYTSIIVLRARNWRASNLTWPVRTYIRTRLRGLHRNFSRFYCPVISLCSRRNVAVFPGEHQETGKSIKSIRERNFNGQIVKNGSGASLQKMRFRYLLLCV